MSKNWLNHLLPYKDVRVLQILLIGTISGFPWVLIGSMMTLWLKDEGLSRSAIGLFGYVFAVFAINFLWAPLVDTIRVPFLSKRIGQRKAWILAMQIIILLAAVAMYFISAQTSLAYVAVTALVIATAAATQDVAIDALRIELVAKNEQALVVVGAAMATAGWYTGYNAGGALALYGVAELKEIGVAEPWNPELSTDDDNHCLEQYRVDVDSGKISKQAIAVTDTNTHSTVLKLAQTALYDSGFGGTIGVVYLSGVETFGRLFRSQRFAVVGVDIGFYIPV